MSDWAACVGFLEQLEVDAEGVVGLFGAGDGLEDEIDGCAAFDGGECVVTWARTQHCVGIS